MAEVKFTPEIINAALSFVDRIEYASYLDKLAARKALTKSQRLRYEALTKQIEDYVKNQEGTAPPDQPLEDAIGIPERLRVKRRYTMSEAALEQRKKASQSPAKSEGMKGNRNGWKHGRYADNFLGKMKPCKTTCPKYPCSLVDENEVSPGDDCLDKVDVVHFFRAVHEAISNKQYDNFNELAALQISNTLVVVDRLIEDILRDGTVVKREKHDATGNLVIEYVTHPSLLALPKLIADLGLNPAEFLITPRSISKIDDNDKDRNTFAESMTRVSKVMAKLAAKR